MEGHEGASDPALGVREGLLENGASELRLGAVCYGKRGRNGGVPVGGRGMCKGPEMGETVARFRNSVGHKCKRLSTKKKKKKRLLTVGNKTCDLVSFVQG